METTRGLPLCFDTLVFCVGSHRGAKKQTDARRTSGQRGWSGKRKRTGRKTESIEKPEQKMKQD